MNRLSHIKFFKSVWRLWTSSGMMRGRPSASLFLSLLHPSDSFDGKTNIVPIQRFKSRRFQQYASLCRSVMLSIWTTYAVPVDGLWPLIGSSGGLSASAVRYMSHICSGRSSSIIFSLIIRFFSMFRRLYLNSMMVFVYLFSAVTAEPMQVPKELQAKLTEEKREPLG